MSKSGFEVVVWIWSNSVGCVLWLVMFWCAFLFIYLRDWKVSVDANSEKEAALSQQWDFMWVESPYFHCCLTKTSCVDHCPARGSCSCPFWWPVHHPCCCCLLFHPPVGVLVGGPCSDFPVHCRLLQLFSTVSQLCANPSGSTAVLVKVKNCVQLSSA